MEVPGIVTNLTRFGAFVDIGVKQDGLVHVSEIAHKYIQDPSEVLKLNQHVKVKVMEVDVARKRIALSIKQTEAAPTQQSRPAQHIPKLKQSFAAPVKEVQPANMNDALAALKNKFR
jgi:protein Tex